MNHVEEQKDELEALREIYYDGIEVLSDEPPISFSIRIRTQAYSEAIAETGEDSDDEDSDGEQEPDEEDENDEDEGYITIKFDLPPKYPEEKPKMTILASNLDDIELRDLEADLDQKAQESLGMVMILTLVSGIDEWFSSRLEEEPIEAPQKVEVEEQRVFDGTPVTVETFLVWKRKFEAEMAPKVAEIRPDGKLTGRAMFECDKTLAESDLNFVEDLDQTEIEALMQELSHEDGDGNDNDDDGDDDDDDDVDEEHTDTEEGEEEEEEEDNDDDDC